MSDISRRTFATAGAAGVGLLLCTPTANALDRALALTTTRATRTRSEERRVGKEGRAWWTRYPPNISPPHAVSVQLQ
ncbi:hypothetical protein, partial [Amycolatopsis thailandensis]|uniref:hypothetical protein n=1 Tax=Amycolatopsis thailandensis TaxID=589330 RepID=UPI0011786101